MILTFNKCPVQYPVPRSNQSLFRSSYTLTRRGVVGGLGTDSGIIPSVLCVVGRWVVRRAAGSPNTPNLSHTLLSFPFLSFPFRSVPCSSFVTRSTLPSHYRTAEKGSASAVGYFRSEADTESRAFALARAGEDDGELRFPRRARGNGRGEGMAKRVGGRSFTVARVGGWVGGGWW